MITVTVCVGSSCHLKGARGVIERLSEILARHGLEGKVELRGSFCMERCGEGVNWQIDDEPLTSASEAEAVEAFRQRVLEPMGITLSQETEGGETS
jgi:NADH:ubiquinone oxidoreductase subunit E